MHFQTEKRYKTIRHCWFLHTLYIRRGYVIVPKPHFSSREGINSSLSPFWLIVFAVLVQSVAADHINRSCSCRPRSIDHQRVRRYAPFHSIETCARMALRDSLINVFRVKKNDRPNWDANSWHGTVRRCEQLETFPETIKQELRPAVCERQLTDRQTDLTL